MISTTKKDTDTKAKEPVVNESDIVDVEFSEIKKKRFRINGDNSKILELNVSDMGIVARLQEAYPKLDAIQAKVLKYAEGKSESDEPEKDAKALKEFDNDMRELIDFIFNANVSEICAGDGSMYDPIEGMFRYEYIMNKITSLYETNLNNEFKKMKARVNKYAKKK